MPGRRNVSFRPSVHPSVPCPVPLPPPEPSRPKYPIRSVTPGDTLFLLWGRKSMPVWPLAFQASVFFMDSWFQYPKHHLTLLVSPLEAGSCSSGQVPSVLSVPLPSAHSRKWAASRKWAPPPGQPLPPPSCQPAVWVAETPTSQTIGMALLAACAQVWGSLIQSLLCVWHKSCSDPGPEVSFP